MKANIIALAAAASLFGHVSLAAAETPGVLLTGVTGKVLVNAGNGFVPVKKAVKVAPGSEVFVSEGAGAAAHFQTCDVDLMPGTITRVVEAELCQQALLDSPMMLRGTEDTIVVTPTNGYPLPPPPPGAMLVSPYLIAGGIFTVGAIAYGSTAFEKDDPPPAVSAP